ncbi:hypothetical protein D3C72_2384190 [compost metagenome]
MQVRLSGRNARTTSSGIPTIFSTPATLQPSMYSGRGSQTATLKPLNRAMFARYSASTPAPIRSMR